MSSLLIAIPCLNEEHTIGSLIERMPKQIAGISEIRVLVVDDGSTDRTAEIAAHAGAEVVSHHRNLGLGRAFTSALEYALEHDFESLVNIDGDGQFDPADIATLVAPILVHKAEMVTASRFVSGKRPVGIPALKYWGNRGMSAFISLLLGQRFHDVSCGFRAYGREALESLNIHGRFTHTQETFLNLAARGLRIAELPISVRYIEGRRSRVAHSLVTYAVRTMVIILRTYRDYHPVRFFGSIGLCSFLLSLVFLGILGAHYLETGRFSGEIWAGFVGAGLLLFSLMNFFVALTTDMLVGIRTNQERLLAMLRRVPRGSRTERSPRI